MTSTNAFTGPIKKYWGKNKDTANFRYQYFSISASPTYNIRGAHCITNFVGRLSQALFFNPNNEILLRFLIKETPYCTSFAWLKSKSIVLF